MEAHSRPVRVNGRSGLETCLGVEAEHLVIDEEGPR